MSETGQDTKQRNALIDRLTIKLNTAQADVADITLKHAAAVEVSKRLNKRLAYLESIAPVKFKSRTTGREWKWTAPWTVVTETLVK
jgi:hypothetical protein